MNSIFLALFGGLFFSVFAWFYLCYRVFNRLEAKHAETYQALGQPVLFKKIHFQPFAHSWYFC